MTKVTVSVYGRDYTIRGEKPENEILKIAERVDSEMKEAGEVSPYNSTMDIAVLTALNLSEKLIEAEKSMDLAMREKEQASVQAERERSTSQEVQEQVKSYEDKIKQLQNKLNEYETNFFDLQMQNIKLKNELEKIKGETDI